MASSKSIAPFFETVLRPSKSGPARYVCGPCLRQQQNQQQIRTLTQKSKTLKVPKPTPFVPDVQAFLTLIGRGLPAQASKINNWNKLFTSTSEDFKEAGIEPARTRRYLLRWREKFRDGQYGAGGDFQHVNEDGTAELRVVEVPSLSGTMTEFVSAAQTPGMTKLILNVPAGTTSAQQLTPKQQTAELKKPKGYKLVNGHSISGPFALPAKGSHGSVAYVKRVEGMWEDRLGQKVFGGERRRAETLHKLGVAEHRKAIGTAR